MNFVSIPPVDANAEVMFESPRKVSVEDGKLKDFFAPFEVHVYRMHRKPLADN